MAVSRADFLLKALILQNIVGLFIPENTWAIFWFPTLSMGSLKAFFTTAVPHQFQSTARHFYFFFCSGVYYLGEKKKKILDTLFFYKFSKKIIFFLKHKGDDSVQLLESFFDSFCFLFSFKKKVLPG